MNSWTGRKYSPIIVWKAPEAIIKSDRINITFQSSLTDLFVLISSAALGAYKYIFKNHSKWIH